MIRIGYGYDAHRLVEGRKLILGGVDIPHDKGLLGHSDADALIHAVIDAIIGALALGDIGKHFPDTDEKYKDADSMKLLEATYQMMMSHGYELGNMDTTIVVQKPKMAPFIDTMRENIARTLMCDVSKVNVKAKTTEKMGFEGRMEGISAHAVVLLNKKA